MFVVTCTTTQIVDRMSQIQSYAFCLYSVIKMAQGHLTSMMKYREMALLI